jgi:hypothetical protein
MRTDEYEVSMELTAPGLRADKKEDLLAHLVELLTVDAAEFVLGPVGAIHGPVLELLFTVKATDTAELYDKLREVALILGGSAGEFAATSARRGKRGKRELALA